MTNKKLVAFQRKLKREYDQLQRDYAAGKKKPLMEDADFRYLLADLKSGRKRVVIVETTIGCSYP